MQFCILLLVNSVLNVKLSFCDERQKNVSILDLPGDVLIVPQVFLFEEVELAV